MKRPNWWPIFRRGGTLLAISGLAVQTSVAWAQSLEVADRDKTRLEVAKRVEQLVRETAQHDPELAREIERQKELVIHEMKRGRLEDTHLIHEIENVRTVQRELTHRVAQAEVDYRIAEVAGDNPALAHQLRAAFETWRNGDGQETFAGFERGEGIHHLSPEGLERRQRETERSVAEHPEKAGYAREFLRRELERVRPEARDRGQMDTPEHAHQLVERSRAQGHPPEAVKEMHNMNTRGVERAREASAREVDRAHEAPTHEVERAREAPTREVERVREVPAHEVERVREAPVREIERVREVERSREAPTREIERTREAPPREVERVREAPTAERSTERAADHTHDKHDQQIERQQKASRKH